VSDAGFISPEKSDLYRQVKRLEDEASYLRSELARVLEESAEFMKDYEYQKARAQAAINMIAQIRAVLGE
jgi:ElaB/YqjD/DUF883 family membrane-anchored ribosome-binding protein